MLSSVPRSGQKNVYKKWFLILLHIL